MGYWTVLAGTQHRDLRRRLCASVMPALRHRLRRAIEDLEPADRAVRGNLDLDRTPFELRKIHRGRYHELEASPHEREHALIFVEDDDRPVDDPLLAVT